MKINLSKNKILKIHKYRFSNKYNVMKLYCVYQRKI